MRLLTVEEVADRLPFTTSAVYALIRKGSLPARRIGEGRGRLVIIEEELDDWMRTLPVATKRGEIHDLPTAISQARGSLGR
jgi:excisionase family DNA binding protein